MPIGPGKYEDLATYVREKAQAAGVIVLVIDGHKGNGFTVQALEHVMLALPALLRHMADQIESSEPANDLR
jgi:predicted TIM-barrel fold metal-dependent hydrolase